MHRSLAVLALCVATAGVAVATAAACGDVPPQNLHVPAGMRTELRAVFLRAHPALRAEDVAGPLPGHTYYGGNSDFHAVATFQVGGHLAHPSVFWKLNAKSAWRFVRDTHGGVRETDVSPSLLLVWGFSQWRHGPYYVPPR